MNKNNQGIARNIAKGAKVLNGAVFNLNPPHAILPPKCQY